MEVLTFYHLDLFTYSIVREDEWEKCKKKKNNFHLYIYLGVHRILFFGMSYCINWKNNKFNFNHEM